MKSLAVVIIGLTLAGCGGGGESGNTATTTPTQPVNSTGVVPTGVVPSGQILTITSLQLKSSDVIANTKPQTTTITLNSISKLFGTYAIQLANRFIPNAYAVLEQSSYPPVTYDPKFLASRKLIDGNLTRLSPTVKYLEKDSNGVLVESVIQCDFTNTEIYIKKSYELNTSNADVLVLADIPDSIDKNCKISFKNAILYVKGDSTVFNITSAFSNNIVDVIPANDPGFNKSNTPLVVDSTGLVKYIELQSDGKLRAVDLNTVSAPIHTNYTGSYAYDGNKLLGASNISAQSATYFAFQRDSTEFKILKPTGWNTNGYLSTILDDQGRLLFHYASGEFQVLNTTDWSYQLQFAPTIGQFGTPSPSAGFPGNMYGAQGRYEKWILSDRGVLWNYETKASLCLMTFPNTDTSNYMNCASGGKYVRLWGQFAYTVDGNTDNFVRYDISTGKGTSVSLNSKGYLAKSFQVFKNLAMVEVVNSANSDKKFVEVNFETGAVTDRGVISSGSRTVYDFAPIGK